MFLQDEIVVVKKEAVKKFGASGAVILQTLINNNPTEYRIKLDADTWCKNGNILDFMDVTIVKGIITGLAKRGLVTLDGTYLILKEKPVTPTKKKTTKTLFGEEPAKTGKRTMSEKQEKQLEMARTLFYDVFGYSDELTDIKFCHPFAKKLLAAGYTPKQIKSWYGKGGWWYQNDWRGQKGSKPLQSTITETIEDAKKGVVSSKQEDNRDNFFR